MALSGSQDRACLLWALVLAVVCMSAATLRSGTSGLNGAVQPDSFDTITRLGLYGYDRRFQT